MMQIRQRSFSVPTLAILLLSVLSSAYTAASVRSLTTTNPLRDIGVNYGMLGNNLPTPTKVVQLIQSTYIDKVKIYNSDPEVLQAFSNTSMGLVVGVEDEQIPILSKSGKAAMAWVKQRLAPYYPATSITDIAVGNEVLTGTNQALMIQLVPAMENLHKALVLLKIDQKIKISTPQSMAILVNSYPPSSSTFKPSILPIMTPLLKFLSQTGSVLMMNVYPYFAYKLDPTHVSLDYALLKQGSGLTDPNSGLHYSNLFDAQVDAVYHAMKAAGYGEVPVVVSETGWPSAGDADEAGPGMQNAQEYSRNLINYLSSSPGTPSKPNVTIPTYIFALLNENLKPGPTSERNFGLFNPNGSSVYDAGLLKSGTNIPPATSTPPPPPPATSTPHPPYSPAPTPPPPSSAPSPSIPVTPPATSSPPPPYSPAPTTPPPSANPPASSRPAGTSPVWCVADPSTSPELLQQSLDFACGEGGADCQAIGPAQACFNPNTLVAHASYAMNSYFQRHGRNYWNCFFNGQGLLTPTDPSYGSCTYPSQ